MLYLFVRGKLCEECSAPPVMILARSLFPVYCITAACIDAMHAAVIQYLVDRV